ncbi:hypothetical protein H0484_05515 [Pusillimonas sp. CC-YST705]|uniref:Uncharacterized protein n=1 Tax=Mesopusillimonas faecipullorum TaxID=2755040 RepID=A0ABS8CBH5_9BURK|nr:hypothetical protein [Mesopusillimonas faecipullorum]MCB5363214.1 hypothetical protein [Mesopusillimonas faecipullorum]
MGVDPKAVSATHGSFHEERLRHSRHERHRAEAHIAILLFLASKHVLPVPSLNDTDTEGLRTQ